MENQVFVAIPLLIASDNDTNAMRRTSIKLSTTFQRNLPFVITKGTNIDPLFVLFPGFSFNSPKQPRTA